jgi:flavin-dependent dehydrogenase
MERVAIVGGGLAGFVAYETLRHGGLGVGEPMVPPRTPSFPARISTAERASRPAKPAFGRETNRFAHGART